MKHLKLSVVAKNLAWPVIRSFYKRTNESIYAPELLEKVLKGIPDVIGVYKTDHTIIFYNQAGYDFYNTTHDDIKGKKCFEMLYRKEKCPDCPVDKAIHSKVIVRKEKYVAELDKHMDYCCNPVLDEEGKVLFVVELLRDISDSKKLDAALDESGKNYRKIVNLSPDAIVITVGGMIALANHQAMEFLKNPIGESIENFILPNYIMLTRKGISYLLENRASKFMLDLRMIRKNGSIADVEISSSYFSYKGRDAVLSLIRDVSEKNKELNAAANYQLADLQKPFPIQNKVFLETLYIPAKVISGDFYYFHKVDDDVVIGLVGDVCGKSFKAAMAINAFGVLFHEAVLTNHDTKELLKIINSKAAYYFCENYIAALCFCFDFKNNKAEVAGAGINQFIVQKHNQEPGLITVEGAYLGMFENSDFEKKYLDFEQGDRFCFFSDGLDFTFIGDKVNWSFGKEKSIDELKEHIRCKIYDRLSEVNGLKDDCTLLLFEMR